MIGCEQARGWIQLYIDGEIGVREQLALEAHLVECADCRAEHDALRDVVDTVRGSKPLYRPPASLLQDSRLLVTKHQATQGKRARLRAGLLAAAAVLLAVAAVAGLPWWQPQRFTSFAADTHIRYAEGKLLLEVQGEPAERVSAWLQTRLPFALQLPDYPAEAGEQKSYTLVGARTIKYAGDEAAYLAYLMDQRPISLLVTASARAMPSGGETFRSGGLLFHFSSEKGRKLITWRDRGLSYALVSELQVNDAQSCVVCHQSATERRKFQELAPELPRYR